MNMSRISIDVTEDQHKKLKAMAALRGQSIKDFVIKQTLGEDSEVDGALLELEDLLDQRIQATRAGSARHQTENQSPPHTGSFP